jgi:hypothetical protein
MLSTLLIVLVILWLLGVVTSYTLGGFDRRPPGRGHCRRAAPGHSGPKSVPRVVRSVHTPRSLLAAMAVRSTFRAPRATASATPSFTS